MKPGNKNLLLEILTEARIHLGSLVHMRRRYLEAEKEKVAWDKLAEIDALVECFSRFDFVNSEPRDKPQSEPAVVAALRKAVCELSYLKEQTKAHKGGSVDRALQGGIEALRTFENQEHLVANLVRAADLVRRWTNIEEIQVKNDSHPLVHLKQALSEMNSPVPRGETVKFRAAVASLSGYWGLEGREAQEELFKLQGEAVFVTLTPIREKVQS